MCKYRRSEVLNSAQQRERLPKFNKHASGMHLAITASYIQSKIASGIVSLHVLDVFNPICQISSCVMPVSLIVWLELSLMRPYLLLLSHEPPDFVCNTVLNTLTRIDVNKNGVCDIFFIVVGQISWEILVSFI